jgi:hypothetical protein
MRKVQHYRIRDGDDVIYSAPVVGFNVDNFSTYKIDVFASILAYLVVRTRALRFRSNRKLDLVDDFARSEYVENEMIGFWFEFYQVNVFSHRSSSSF